MATVSHSRDEREPRPRIDVNLPLTFQGMEAEMSFVRSYSSHRRRRASRANLIVLGVSAWLVLGLISQAAFQLIG